MTTMEFEGRTEREAVAKAAAELGSESFDVEVLEKGGGIFGRGKVKIRVRALTSIPDPMASGDSSSRKNNKGNSRKSGRPDSPAPRPRVEAQPRPVRVEEPQEPVDPPSDEIIRKLAEFVEGMIERMGFPGTVAHKDMDGAKLIFELTSESSSILIGKKGKNLDALQLLANVYLNRVAGDEAPWRIVLDTEGYRARREESLVRMAHRVADEAARTRSSRLLEPMNPFERRLVHTAINERGRCCDEKRRRRSLQEGSHHSQRRSERPQPESALTALA